MNGKIAYFTLRDTDTKSGYIGAVLVIDSLGKPEEFRVTYPVKPTPLQKTLYGQSMMQHIGVELCGKPLLDALKNKPSLLIVSDVEYLLLAEGRSYPVVFLESLKEIKVVREGEKINTLESPTSRFSPVAVSYPISYSTERQQYTHNFIQNSFVNFDLIEPFTRIQVALGQLQKQDSEFQ